MNNNEQMFITNLIFIEKFFYTIMDEQIRLSETRQFKAIFPNTLNANDSLFGGQAMRITDLCPRFQS